MSTEAIYPVLGMAVLLQVGAACMAWRLIRVTGKHVAWFFIATALFFMAIRRSLSFFWLSTAQHAGLPAASEELTAFTTSLLMFMGVAAIRPLFESIRDSRDRLAQEVRERTEAQERLRESEQRYRSLFENSRDAICILNKDGGFIDANPALSSLLGYSKPEVMAMNVGDLFETAHELTRLKARLDGHGFVKEHECPMRTREGFIRACLITSSAHTTADGTVQYHTMFRDVTEQRQAALTIQMEKQRFQSLAENAPFGLLMVDQEGTFQYLNPKFRELFGYEAADIPHGRDWFRKAFPDPAYRRDVIQTWITDLRNSEPGEQRPRIFHVRCKDNTTKTVHFRPVQLPSSEHIVSCEDITQLKHAQEALEQNEQMLRTILSATPSAITYLQDGAIRWTNPAMLTMFGLTREDECLGKKAREFYSSQEEYERVLALFKERVHVCEPLETEALFKRKNGAEFHGDLKIKRLSGPSAKRELITAITDISERVKAQEELRAGEEKYRHLYEESKRQHELYRSLLDSSPDAVVVYDMDGLTQYVNRSFTGMFGWTLEQVRDQRIPYVPDSERESSMTLIRNLVEEGVPCSGFETRRFTSDGHLLEISLSASRYHDHAGKPAGMLVVLSDITERKLLEEKIRQAAKMEAIGRMAGGLAHDFNNILTAVIGYANLLANELPDRDSALEKLSYITNAAEKAAELTRQLLAFSRRQVLEVTPLQLNDIISDVEGLLTRLVGEDIELVTALDEAAGVVRADQIQIQQILMNLVINARDAMPNGGKVTIDTSNAVLDESYCRMYPEVAPGQYVVFCVSDNGMGMDAKTLSCVFEPFFTTKDKGVGTGLGLSTVYGIVKQHSGHVTVYSEPDRGTTFKIYLPRTGEAPIPRTHLETARVRPLGTETVLIVEDEEMVRQLACEALTMLGYRTLCASTPGEAIEISSSYREEIELLLTDVVLPQMDGRTLFDTIAPHRPNLKVLYVSGYTENFIVHHGVLDKGVHFMQKPFNVDNLARKVREILDSNLRA